MVSPNVLKVGVVVAVFAGVSLLTWCSERPRRSDTRARNARGIKSESAQALSDALLGRSGDALDAGAPDASIASPAWDDLSLPDASGASDASDAPDAFSAMAGSGERALEGPGPRTVLHRANVVLSTGPLYFTGAFDGSQRFGMWADTLSFARSIERNYGKKVHFTYFINSCYYDALTEGSLIGRAESVEEVLVRRALTQQAINEGHEIANHTAHHRDGSAWSVDEWRREITDFHSVIDASLFVPVRGDDGEPVFPRFRPVSGATAGSTGASCSSDKDCASSRCLPLTASRSFCTQACNLSSPCPKGTACGTPGYSVGADVCVPVPEYPIAFLDEELFGADGQPNRKHPVLVPYRVVGFRAPFLGYNDALLEVLLERGYAYDASLVLDPGPPLKLNLLPAADPGGAGALAPPAPPPATSSMFELGLMQYPGARTFPMDYNYRAAGARGDRMLSDYTMSLLSAHGSGRRWPWNVGHHFALWNEGEYWHAMKDTFELAAKGCPGGNNRARCPGVEFPTFRELSRTLAAQEERRRGPFSAHRDVGPIVRAKPRLSAGEGAEPH